MSIHESNLEWQQAWVDLTPWQGQTVTLTLALHQMANEPLAWAYVDEISIGSTYPDVWVDINNGNAAPDQEVTQTILYGNRGGAAAGGVVLTYTLPAGLTFVSASVAPVSTDPLVWQLADQPAKGDPYEILMTTAVNGAAFNHLTGTAVIATDDTELELLNNEAEANIYTAVNVYLPLVFR